MLHHASENAFPTMLFVRVGEEEPRLFWEQDVTASSSDVSGPTTALSIYPKVDVLADLMATGLDEME